MRECRKKAHRSKTVALNKKKLLGDSLQMNVYYCDQCRGWHLGRSRSEWRAQQRIDQLLGKR